MGAELGDDARPLFVGEGAFFVNCAVVWLAQACGGVFVDDGILQGGFEDVPQRGDDHGDLRLRLAGETVDVLLQLDGFDGSQIALAEGGDQMFVEDRPVAVLCGRLDKRLLADPVPFDGVSTEHPVVFQSCAGDVSFDDLFAFGLQLGLGTAGYVFDDCLPIGVHADFHLGAVKAAFLLLGHVICPP